MSEIEAPIEQVQEHIHEVAHHSNESWVSRVALFSALLAVIAAVAALMAGHHSNEAMITQIKASNAWNYYQAKGIKAAILQSKIDLISEVGKNSSEKDNEKIFDYKKEQEEIQKSAQEFQTESENHLKTHEILARAVTFFQVAIAISAITVLTRRKKFLYVSFAFSLLGLFSFAQSFLK